MQGPFNLHPSTPGGQALIEDTQGKLAELLEEESLEDASLSEFLAVLLSRAPDRATVEAELVELLQDLAPILLDWCAHRTHLDARIPVVLAPPCRPAPCLPVRVPARIARHALTHPASPPMLLAGCMSG